MLELERLGIYLLDIYLLELFVNLFVTGFLIGLWTAGKLEASFVTAHGRWAERT